MSAAWPLSAVVGLLLCVRTAATAAPEEAPAERRGLRVARTQVDGRLDLQLMHMDAEGLEPHVMAAEAEILITVASAERDVLDIALQWPYYTDMRGVDGRGREMHFGNAYLVYRTGFGRPNLRLGQFVVPFGNLTHYETHTFPLQSLYPESLGLRIDRGASLEGYAGEWDWWLALTGGNGPRADNDRQPIMVARAARTHQTAGGALTLGLSGLLGRQMPRFSPLVDPLMDHDGGEHGGHAPALEFANKRRLALDLEYVAGLDLWRGEVVLGKDGDGPARGGFAQWGRALGEGREVTLQAAGWQQPSGRRMRLGAAYGLELDPTTTLRLAAERRAGRTDTGSARDTVVWLQVLRELPALAPAR